MNEFEKGIRDLLAMYEKTHAAYLRQRAVLESIAANTCCDGCQEAAKVARNALDAQATTAARLTQMEPDDG